MTQDGMFRFYYDESEHSRVITSRTVSADNFYDGFVVTVIGWDQQDEGEIESQFRSFANKHFKRMIKGELKSTTIRQTGLKRGFASLSRQTAIFLNDFFDLFDERCYIYISCFSKVEHVVEQLFAECGNSPLINMDNAKYSITKAIVVYRPENMLDALHGNPEAFVKELKSFLLARIEANKVNLELKSSESQQFRELLYAINSAVPVRTFCWDYKKPLAGFKKYLDENSIERYSLIIDKETNTVEAARSIGLSNVSEEDSRKCFALQMADVLAGIVAKLMKALAHDLRDGNEAGEVRKRLLDVGWFRLTQDRLILYKKLYKIIKVFHNSWDKVFAGRYSDDLICLISLLDFFNHFETAEELRAELEMRPEHYNSIACEELMRHFSLM